MKSFSEFLHEGYDNYLKPDENKKSVAKEVFDMLQKAYAPIGGIHGNGFNSPDDMVQNIPFWKTYRKNGELKAVALYKDSGTGRKRVAIATDGTKEGKDAIKKIVKDDFTRDRAFAEISGPSLAMLAKNMDVKEIAQPISVVKKILPKDNITVPPDDDDEIRKHPELKPYFYQREIGGHKHTKIMVGTVGNRIY